MPPALDLEFANVTTEHGISRSIECENMVKFFRLLSQDPLPYSF